MDKPPEMARYVLYGLALVMKFVDNSAVIAKWNLVSVVVDAPLGPRIREESQHKSSIDCMERLR